MEAAFIFYMNSLFTVPFLCIFIVSILILILSLANSRGERKVKNMIPIVIISGVLGLIGFKLLELYVNILSVSMRLLLASGILFFVGFIIRRLRKNCYVKK
jgi:hypothetical protein